MDKENEGVLTPRNRVISESTGLFKLQLSPQRNLAQTSPTRSKGLKVSVPIVEQIREPSLTKSDLLVKYASKQAKLMEVEKQAEMLRFELLELQAQLHLEINKDRPLENIKSRANEEVSILKKKVSTMFLANWPVGQDKEASVEPKPEQNSNHQIPPEQPNQQIISNQPNHQVHPTHQVHPDRPSSRLTLLPGPELTKKASNMFLSNHQLMKKKASTIFNNQETMKKASTIFATNQEAVKKKASTMFNNAFLADVRDRIDHQQAEIDKFAKRGSHLARDFFTSLTPRKEKAVAGVDSSFMFENVETASEDSVGDILSQSILLSEDDTVDQVDIDDYSSSEE